MTTFRAILGRVSGGEHLSQEEMAFAIDQLMQGEVPENEMALFLTALRVNGETADEIAGAALAMRRHMTSIRTSRTNVVDTCGTGGVGSRLFNVSTSAAIVAAASGVAVAKHGNRSFTSRSGSANVLSELGVNIEAPVPVVERCLEELGICFCFAPRLHLSMRHVGPVRQKLGTPTIFNLLGPLCNPAGARFQLLGVGREDLRLLLATVLQKLGAERAAVVSGHGGVGEVALSGETQVALVEASGVSELVWHPRDFGVEVAAHAQMEIDGPPASAALIRQVLDGVAGPARDMVVINAAATLWVAGVDASLAACAARAAAAIDSGAARNLLRALAELTWSGGCG